MNVKLFRLITGEDLISEFTLEGNTIILKSPYKIIYMVQPNDMFRVSLIPWVFDSLVKNNEFPILGKDVLTYVDPADKLLETYKNSVSEDKKNPILPIEEELDIMDKNEERIKEEDFLNMVKDKLQSLQKRTLH